MLGWWWVGSVLAVERSQGNGRVSCTLLYKYLFERAHQPKQIPPSHQATLGERGVGLQELTGTCKEYCRFLRAARSDPLPVQMVVLWAVEVAYHESWRKHRPMPEPYHVYAERWASPGFADYVAQLALLADRALQGQPGEVLALAREAFAEVCRLEKAFWDMVVTTAE